MLYVPIHQRMDRVVSTFVTVWTAVNIHVQVLRESMFSFLLGVDLGSRIAGSCGNSV